MGTPSIAPPRASGREPSLEVVESIEVSWNRTRRRIDARVLTLEQSRTILLSPGFHTLIQSTTSRPVRTIKANRLHTQPREAGRTEVVASADKARRKPEIQKNGTPDH
jgi:hypothetical protein